MEIKKPRGRPPKTNNLLEEARQFKQKNCHQINQ